MALCKLHINFRQTCSPSSPLPLFAAHSRGHAIRPLLHPPIQHHSATGLQFSIGGRDGAVENMRIEGWVSAWLWCTAGQNMSSSGLQLLHSAVGELAG